jgi:hypothetical protein
MSNFYVYLFLLAVGGLYWLLSLNRHVYINSPAFDFKQRFKYLGAHVGASAVLGIVTINIILKIFFSSYYDYVIKENLLVHAMIGAMVVSFLLISAVINYTLRKTHSEFMQVEIMSNISELVETDASFETKRVMDDEEFWEFISMLSNNKRSIIHYKRFINQQLELKNLKWMVEFYHCLIEKRNLLIQNNAYPISKYIFRKYEEDFSIPLMEFIILQGKESYNFILTNMDVIAHLDLNANVLHQGGISNNLKGVFKKKKGKILVPQTDFENISWDSRLLQESEFKETYPLIFNKYRKAL